MKRFVVINVLSESHDPWVLWKRLFKTLSHLKRYTSAGRKIQNRRVNNLQKRFLFQTLRVNNDTPEILASLSLSLSRSTATCAKLKFLSGCDMIGLLIRNETKPNLSLSLFQGWRCPGVAAGSINRPVKKCLALGPAINHLWLMMTDFLFKAPCLSCGIELQTRQVFRLEDIKSSNILGRLRAIREFTTET